MTDGTPSERAAFGSVLRRFRERRGLSQERLAEASGLDRTFVSLLERNRRQPTLSTMLTLSRSLGVTLVELAREIEQELEGHTSTDPGEDSTP